MTNVTRQVQLGLSKQTQTLLRVPLPIYALIASLSVWHPAVENAEKINAVRAAIFSTIGGALSEDSLKKGPSPVFCKPLRPGPAGHPPVSGKPPAIECIPLPFAPRQES